MSDHISIKDDLIHEFSSGYIEKIFYFCLKKTGSSQEAEELALALGIAAPYMEEEVQLLVDSELLKRLEGGRYITDFFIAPRECQDEVNEISCQYAQRHYEKYWALAETAKAKAVELGYDTGAYSENDAVMYFAFWCQQEIELSVQAYGIYSSHKRKDGGNWGFIGFERGSSMQLSSGFFSNNGCGFGEHTEISWDGFQALDQDSIFWKKRYKKDVPGSYLLPVLKRVAAGDVGLEDQRVYLEELAGDGFLVKEGDRFRVNAICGRRDQQETLRVCLQALPEYKCLKESMRQYLEKVRAVLERYSNPYVKEEFNYFVGMSIRLREIFACLWVEQGLYYGESAQFCVLYD